MAKVPSAGPAVPSGESKRSPLFEAQNSDRYARQGLIKEIQEETGRKLLVYAMTSRASISDEDIQPFCDLLAPLKGGENVDLILHSGGGSADAAEKILYMCRQTAAQFRVIVPELAKSAATLIALGSDEVIMGLASELGPIDAQVTGPGPGGARFQTSAQSFLDEFDRIKAEVAASDDGVLSPAYYPLLEGLNIGFMRMCRKLMKRSRNFAEKWLKKHMCDGDEKKAKKITADFCDVEKWVTHGEVIDADEAAIIGVNVKKLDQHDQLWEKLWYLHCCYGVLFRTTSIVTIFESDTVSLQYT